MAALAIRLFAVGLVCGAAAVSSSAYAIVVLASDDASQGAYNDGWSTGDNGGSGFAAWSAINRENGTGFGGGFMANNDANSQISTSSKAFGVFGNGGGVGQAIRPLSTAMVVNDRFSLDMDNGFIDSGGTVGFGLQNSSGNNLFEFFFVGGESSYKVFSAAGSNSTGVTFTNEGLRLQLTVTGAASFTFTIDKINDGIGSNVTTVNGNLISAAGGQAIARMRLFNANGGADAYFNSFEVAAVPESSAWLFSGMAALLASALCFGRSFRSAARIG